MATEHNAKVNMTTKEFPVDPVNNSNSNVNIGGNKELSTRAE